MTVWAYALWIGGLAAVLGSATFAILATWNRQVLREHDAALRLVEAQEAERRRHAESERRALEILAESERRHRALAEAGAIAVWLANAGGRLVRLDGNWESLTGQPAAEVLASAEGWLETIHPDERASAQEAWRRAIGSGKPYEAEYRVRDASNGGWRWCRARAVPIRRETDPTQPEGAILEWVGVIEDTDARRQAEAERLLLAREVNHRARNALAVVQAIVRLSGSRGPEAVGITERIAALARAHDLLAQAEWQGAGLREVAERELEPFTGPADAPRVRLSGVDVLLDSTAVQPTAMLLHELATNAAKHGAIAQGGRIELAWRLRDAVLEIEWSEYGARIPAGVPKHRGFGSRLIEMTVRGQLGGTLDQVWVPSGLVCRIMLPAARNVARAAVDIAEPPQAPAAGAPPPAPPGLSPLHC